MLKKRLTEYPAVALIGRHRSGKAVLAKQLGGTCYCLDQGADLIKADRRFLVSRTKEVIETQTHVSCNLEWLLAHLDRARRK